MMNKNKTLGFTLMELLISVLILGILAGVAVPQYSQMATKNRLVNESEKVLHYLIYARSEAVKNNANVTVSFSTGANWCVGLSDSGACNCTTANSCTLTTNTSGGNATVEKVINVSTSSGFSLTVDNSLNNADFDPLRGMLQKANAPTTGTLTLSNGSIASTINVNVLGRTDICSSSLGNYTDC